MNFQKSIGNYACRIAASKGLFDVIIFDEETKTIRLVEVKNKKTNLGETARNRILGAMKHLEGEWVVVGEIDEGN